MLAGITLHHPLISESDFDISSNFSVKGVLHLVPQKAPELACIVLYLKIINIFLKNDIYIL